jgi:hypothetical protein
MCYMVMRLALRPFAGPHGLHAALRESGGRGGGQTDMAGRGLLTTDSLFYEEDITSFAHS